MAAKDASVAKMHSEIDARLDRIRASLAELMPPPPPPPKKSQRPLSATSMPEPPHSKDDVVLLYMPPFETQHVRAARRAARAGSAGARAGSAGARAGLRARPEPADTRPIGYRILATHPSTPAYSMRRKIVLSANLDPARPDEGPGPGAYNLMKY